jgi:hypothetical protein
MNHSSSNPFKNAHSKESNKKRIDTIIEKYGHRSHFHSKEVKDKIKRTNNERYGVDCVFQSKDIRKKIKETNNKRYNTDTPLQSKEILQKTHQTQRELYDGVGLKSKYIKDKAFKARFDNKEKNWKSFISNKEYAQKVWNTYTPTQIAKDHNVDLSTVYNAINAHDIEIQGGKSSYETVMINEIKKFYNGIVIQSDRVQIKPYEIDIYIPEKNVGIEICGLYYHSEKFKDQNYHKNKLNLCIDKGIRLFTIFEDEVVNSFKVILDKLKYILCGNTKRIYARNTIIRTTSNADRKEILSLHHIQGDAGGLNIGLYEGSELVSIGVFKKRTKTEYELVRFCSSCSVIGGFSKVIKNFTRQNPEVKKIVSFADLRYVDSNNNVYRSNKWKEEYEIKPDYSFVRSLQRLHKFNLRQFDNKNKDYINEGFLKIYDCGKIKYTLTI